MDTVLFVVGIFGVAMVVYWYLLNRDVPDDKKTDGLLAYRHETKDQSHSGEEE